MTLYAWLGMRRRAQVRSAVAAWKFQRRGVLSESLAKVIVVYRTAGWSQAEITKLFGVGRSTIYRHTKGRVPRYSRRWIKRELRSPVSVYC